MSKVFLLSEYFSSTSSNVFSLNNLPEVVKGALFSRYSRNVGSLKEVFIKFFCDLDNHSNVSKDSMEKIKNYSLDFYLRILDKYGDDSVSELGGIHVAFENVSMLCAKFLEDSRIGGSYIEKSTRYVLYGDKALKNIPYYLNDQLSETSKILYKEAMDKLFKSYFEIYEELLEEFKILYPNNFGYKENVYIRSLKCKVFDTIRGILPVSTLTNLGVYGNGRFFSGLLQKMLVADLYECKNLYNSTYDAIEKSMGAFVSKSFKEHPYAKSYQNYELKKKNIIKNFVTKFSKKRDNYNIFNTPFSVKLLSCTDDAENNCLAGILFDSSFYTFEESLHLVSKLSIEEKKKMFSELSNVRENRRHKISRAFELVDFNFEIITDFATYRDLHRHRLVSQERQLFTPYLGYFISAILKNIDKGKIEKKIINLMEMAYKAYEILSQKESYEEAQYVLPMAFNVRFRYKMNMRELQWIIELRSIPQGHITYRLIAIELSKILESKYKFLYYMLKFLNNDTKDELDRLQEISNEVNLSK